MRKRLGILDEQELHVRTTARGLTATASTLVVTAAFCLATGLTGGAAAADLGGDPTPGPNTPSKAQVAAAAARADAKADDVASLRRSLASANQRLDAASTRAEIATEKFDAARWHLQQARTSLTQARSQAASAAASVSSQRADVARLVNASYRGGTQLDQLTVIVDSRGPESVLDKLGLLQSATASMDATYDRYLASLSMARVAKAKAAAAEKAAAKLAAQAKSTRATAAAAQAAAQQDASAITTQRTRVVHQLAKARGISVALARQRQDALEKAAQLKAQQAAAQQAAQQQAAELAAQQQAAEQAAQQQAAAQASASATPATSPSSSPTSSATTGQTTGQTTSATSSPTPGTLPTTVPTPAPATSAAVAQAIAYARAQLGKPYVWAAAGPSSFDCSGLTMRAWEAGGIALPHYSAGQYAAITHITVSQLQPGDLVFWGSSPGSIHHVALYIGNDQIIQAPRTGQDVEVSGIDDWIAPTYFGRP